MTDIERWARIIGQAETEMPPEYMDELIQHPAANSWDAPTMPRWEQWEEPAKAVAAAHEATILFLRLKLEELEKGLRSVMIGGNHLGLVIGADHPPYTASFDAARAHYGPGDKYEVWNCWRNMMLVRDQLDAASPVLPKDLENGGA